MMTSNAVSQALYMVPRSTAPFCGLPAWVSRREFSLRSTVPLIHSGFVAGKFTGHRSSVVLRAEENSGAAELENEEEIEVEAEAEAEEEVVEVEERPPRKPRVKLGDIMGILNKRAIEESEKVRKTPDLRTGDVVEIKLEVPENRRRLSIYKGIVMSKQNAGIHTTIRIRRIIAGIGVEIVFPVYSPIVKEIRVLSHRKVRRARLYYLRDKLPRLSTFK